MWLGVAVGGVLILSGVVILVRAWAIIAREALQESSVAQAERLRRGQHELKEPE